MRDSFAIRFAARKPRPTPLCCSSRVMDGKQHTEWQAESMDDVLTRALSRRQSQPEEELAAEPEDDEAEQAIASDAHRRLLGHTRKISKFLS